jgi:hypothetical protein
VPVFFKFVIKFVTPLLLGAVFFSSLPEVWKRITNVAIYAEIAKATDPGIIAELEKQILFVNGSRLLLLGVFAGIATLVGVAYRKRVREGRI